MATGARFLAFAVFGFFLVSSPLAFAEAEDQPTLETEIFNSNIIGSVDIRPSWTTRTGEFHIENYMELGAQVTKDTLISYYQAVYTNLFQPSGDVSLDGMHPTLPYGFLRARFNNLWEDKRNGLSFGYEPRVLLPTAPSDRDHGMIGVLRNYIRLTKTFSPVFAMQFIEMPVLQGYSQTGYVSAGAASANPAFENRTYVVNIINLSKKLTFLLPVMFHATKYQNFRNDAANNNAWSFFAWTYPEFTYALSPKTSLGVAFYSDNLITSDLKKMDLSKGLQKGILQFSVATTL